MDDKHRDERIAERRLIRESVNGYDRPEFSGPEPATPSPATDARVLRDAAWLLLHPDPDAREAALYVLSMATPRAQAELYARVRFHERARADFARFVDSELRLLDTTPIPSQRRDSVALEALLSIELESRGRWAEALFAALDDHDRADLRHRVDELRSVSVQGARYA